jgi:hypothetical protein
MEGKLNRRIGVGDDRGQQGRTDLSSSLREAVKNAEIARRRVKAGQALGWIITRALVSVRR